MSKIERIDRCATAVVIKIQNHPKAIQKYILKKLGVDVFTSWVVARAAEMLAYGMPIKDYADYKRVRTERLVKTFNHRYALKPSVKKKGGDMPKNKSESVLGLILLLGFIPLKHKMIFSAINDVWADGDPVDMVTLHKKLEEKGQLEEIGGAAYLAYLVDNAPFDG